MYDLIKKHYYFYYILWYKKCPINTDGTCLLELYVMHQVTEVDLL